MGIYTGTHYSDRGIGHGAAARSNDGYWRKRLPRSYARAGNCWRPVKDEGRSVRTRKRPIGKPDCVVARREPVAARSVRVPLDIVAGSPVAGRSGSVLNLKVLNFVKQVIWDQCHVDWREICSKSRSRPIAKARQLAAYLLYRHTTYSLPKIGSILGGRHHSTILYSIDAVADDMRAGHSYYPGGAERAGARLVVFRNLKK